MNILMIDDDCHTMPYRPFIEKSVEIGDKITCCSYISRQKYDMLGVETFDLIILDLSMPLYGFPNSDSEKYPGIVILKEIRKITDVPVVLFTCYSKDEEISNYIKIFKNVSYYNKLDCFPSDLVGHIHNIVLID